MFFVCTYGHTSYRTGVDLGVRFSKHCYSITNMGVVVAINCSHGVFFHTPHYKGSDAVVLYRPVSTPQLT